MALALYRKYRPATFGEVVGQEHVTEPLIQALTTGRINHAYLFSGPRGCGKTSSARILARSLNCAQGPTPSPCGTCESCLALAPDGPGSLDVIEIDAASHGGVDDARDLRERAFFAPVNSRYKVYIVDEAHMVTPQGFNALLKLVEEPPEFLVFVFATTEPDKVLPTIRSRTHHYPFRLLPPGVMRGLLEQICASEGVAVEPAVFPLVVHAGGGSARDSLSVLDQLLAGAGPEGVTYQRAVALLGVTDAALLDDMVSALAVGDGAAVFETVDRVVEAGHDPRRFAVDLLERLRDLVVLDAVPDAVSKGLIDGPADQLERMTDQARRLGSATLSRFADIVHGGLIEMRGTTSPRLLLELLCARMLLPAASTDGAALLQRLERLERRHLIEGAVPREPGEQVRTHPMRPPSGAPGRTDDSGHGGDRSDAGRSRPQRAAEPPTPAGTAGSPAGQVASPTSVVSSPAGPPAAAGPAPSPGAPAPRPAEPARQRRPLAGGTVDAAGVRRIWPEVMEWVKQRSKRSHALLMNATASAVEADTLVLSLSSAPLARMLSEDSNVETIRAALYDVLGLDWKIRCVVETPAESAGGAGVAAGPARYEDDPRDEETFEPDPPQPAQRQDPEQAAVALLQSTLGARRIADD